MFEPLPITADLMPCFAFPDAGIRTDDPLVPEICGSSSNCGGRLESIKQKFIHAYSRLNILSDQLASPVLPIEQKEALLTQRQFLERAIVAFQDACIPFGFVVEAVDMVEAVGVAKVLRFTHPTPDGVKKPKAEASDSSSSFDILIPIPDASGITVDGKGFGDSAPSASGKQRIILKAFLSPGDILMLTAAVREIAESCPGRFEIDVRTLCGALWEHNPHIIHLEEWDPSVRTIDCEYPIVHHSNQRPYHFIHGYIRFLSKELGIDIEPTQFKGDVYLSEQEKSTSFISPDDNPGGLPVWIISAGGKYDFTIKWWHWRRYQEVVDAFRDRILFVQVGEEGHFHPKLNHTLDLRGKTTLRDMVHLMHWADGVVCGVTFHMHLAAATPLRHGQKARPAIVVAGGREPPHWEAYPTHQFLHTVGLLPCCSHGGCWKSRTLPLGDGDAKDDPENLCVDVVGGLPRCMDHITADQVCRQIDLALRSTLLDKNKNGKDNYGELST